MHRGQPAGHEAANAARCVRDFADLKQTTLVLPEVMWAKKRVMVMECACLGSLKPLLQSTWHSSKARL